MDQFNIAMWTKIGVEPLQCAVVAVYLLKMEQYDRQREAKRWAGNWRGAPGGWASSKRGLMSEQEGPEVPVCGSVVSLYCQYQPAVSEPSAGRVGLVGLERPPECDVCAFLQAVLPEFLKARGRQKNHP